MRLPTKLHTYIGCFFLATLLSIIPITISQFIKDPPIKTIIVTESSNEEETYQPHKIVLNANNVKACRMAYLKIVSLIEKTDVYAEETEEEYLTPPEAIFEPFTTYIYNGERKKLPASENLQRLVYEISEEYELPYRVVLALLGVETTWNENPDHVEVHDDAKYIGIGCINEKYHAENMAKRGIDIYALAGNVEAICWILKAQYDRFGTIEYALMAYNAGAGHVQWATERGISENGYTRTVLRYADSFE